MRRWAAPLARVLAALAASACADAHQGTAQAARTSSQGADSAAIAMPSLLCDDHGAIVDPLVLELVPDGAACQWRIVQVPEPLEPVRFWVKLDGELLDAASDGYQLDGDVIQLLGRACSEVSAGERAPHVLQVSYGSCHRPQ